MPAWSATPPSRFGFAAGVKMRVIAARRSTPEPALLVTAGDSKARVLDDARRTNRDRPRLHRPFPGAGRVAQARTSGQRGQSAFMLPADAKAALLSGAVDAWSTWEPYTRNSK